MSVRLPRCRCGGRLVRLLLGAAIALPVLPACGEEAPSPAPPPFEQLRYDEDANWFRDPDRRVNLLDDVKFLPLDAAADAYLSLGGEIRERYEVFHDAQWGGGPQDQGGYALQRYMFHADVHAGEHVRAFLQLKSGIESGRHGGARPTDEDRFDGHQAFVDLSGSLTGSVSLTLRGGRQELQYGTARIVSAREGPNVRQSFDGVKLIADSPSWRVDAFVTRPVETNPGVFDDGPDHGRAFWGLYFTRALPIPPDAKVDLYYLGLDRQGAVFEQGKGHESRHSFGARVFGHPRPWDYNFEGLWQIGTFADAPIRAWTLASDTGYTLATFLQPRLGLKADVASGDSNPDGKHLGTFNALFPRGAYFGESSLIGPANFVDLHPSVTLKFPHDVTVLAGWDFFWRYSRGDGLYGVAGNLLRSGAGSRERYVGSQAQVRAEWALQRHLSLVADYEHFFSGPFLEDTGPAKDVDYVSLWMTFRF